MPKKETDPGAERAFRAWLHAAHSTAHSRRTANQNAQFFLPHLKPGMRLLDAGCGPGSITIGLAEAVAPGEVVGIDANPAVIAAANAMEPLPDNLRFKVADIHGLPFDDDAFDGIFVHAVLQHVPDATAALKKLRRVLKPGGVIGVADADYGGSILWPSSQPMRRAQRLMRTVRQRSGGDMHAGRKLRDCLARAGFENVVASVSAAADGDAMSVARTGAFWSAYYASAELAGHLEAMGVASPGELAEASAAWRWWGTQPGAYWARFWCEAVARKPG